MLFFETCLNRTLLRKTFMANSIGSRSAKTGAEAMLKPAIDGNRLSIGPNRLQPPSQISRPSDAVNLNGRDHYAPGRR